jgi:hypothetical protein
LNGSLEFELNNDKNSGNELVQIISVYRDILESEVETLGKTERGDAKGMADIIVLGGRHVHGKVLSMIRFL